MMPYNTLIHKDMTSSHKMNEIDFEEIQSSMVKIAEDAAKEGYFHGILTSAEFLRKTAEINPQYSEILNICAQAIADLIKEYQK
jgi:hypothetical protein